MRSQISIEEQGKQLLEEHWWVVMGMCVCVCVGGGRDNQQLVKKVCTWLEAVSCAFLSQRRAHPLPLETSRYYLRWHSVGADKNMQ